MTADDRSVLLTVAEIAAYAGPDLYLFLGISTAGSSVHEAFPVWAPRLAPGGVMRGVDLPAEAAPEQYRSLLVAMRDNPHVRGAVVTSHKLSLYRAAADLFDHTDPLVDITHEVNSIQARDGRLGGFARDAQSLDLILDTTATAQPAPERPIICIGAGGSAIALMLAVGLDVHATIRAGRPLRRAPGAIRGSLTVLGRRQAALDEIAAVRERAGLAGADIRLVLARGPEEIGAVTRTATPGTVIANATGLGKLSPGSPVDGADAFPAGVVAWDFNYRGPLTFLSQARAAGVTVEDGWDYFLAGWTAGLAAIGDQSLTDDLFGWVREVSAVLRP
ncbi:MAG: hypothetical protein VB080_00500 [Propionicimonas sp.]|uniref:hypothetical protein n=1 Tax=Propionicimonas sp. TaxID=1955623 RepID=UPI002B21B32C|nr:hypothetical protein [Propionicimonas sp.]MEA4942893.1 hypothetical protein [Propionicimonas sp.]